jgi:hypothetical protein
MAVEELDQFRRMAKLIPENRRDDLKRGVLTILKAYKHKVRHTGDSEAGKSTRASIREAIGAAKHLIDFAERLDAISDGQEEFEAIHASLRLSRRLKPLPLPATAERLRFAAELAATAAAAIQKTFSVNMSAPKKRPKLPQVPPTMELIDLWERLTDRRVTPPKVAKGSRGAKNRGTNANADAEFVFQGLRLLNPDLTEPNGRTLIKNAIAARESNELIARELIAGFQKRRGKLPSRSEGTAEALRYTRNKKKIQK